MTSMTMAFDGVRELSVEEIDAVAGAAAPALYIAGRAAVGAVIGAAAQAAYQATAGDGLGWEDWDEIAISAGAGAVATGGGGVLKLLDKAAGV